MSALTVGAGSGSRNLAIGDILTLETANGTFLSADVQGTVMWDIARNGSKTPLQFERCMWRICEKLSYADAELVKSLATRGRSRSTTAFERQMIEDQADKEAERNEEDMKRSRGGVLLYGQTVQLQHVATGLFLACRSNVAKIDKNTLGVYLEQGASTCYFRVSPRYKVRTEGGQVLVNDEILLCSLSSPGFYVHESVLSTPPPESKCGNLFSEANLSRELTECGITADLYARYSPADDEDYLRTDSAFCFWTPDNEAFIRAECDTTLTNHKVVIGPRLLDIPSPSHPSVFSASSAWTLEHVDRRDGGLIQWNKPLYRLKHLASRKYLTVSTTGTWSVGNLTRSINYAGQVSLDSTTAPLSPSPPPPLPPLSASNLNKAAQQKQQQQQQAKAPAATPGAGAEVVDKEDIEITFEVSLEEANDDFLDHVGRQTFSVEFVERPRKYVPKEDVLVVLVHKLPDGTKLHLHAEKEDLASTLALPSVSISSSAASSSSSSSSSKNKAQEQVQARECRMSSILRNYDACMLVSVPAKFEELIEFISNALPVLRSYQRFITEEGGSTGALSSVNARLDFENEYFVLTRLVQESIDMEFDDEFKDDEVFSVSGPAFPVFQNCAREQNVLEALVACIVAPSLQGMVLEYSDKNAKKTADWIDVRFKKIVRVHRLLWCAVKFLVQDCDLSEERLVAIRAKTRRFTATARKELMERFAVAQKAREEAEDAAHHQHQLQDSEADDGSTRPVVTNSATANGGGETTKPRWRLSIFSSSEPQGDANKTPSSAISQTTLATNDVNAIAQKLPPIEEVSAMDVLISQIQFPVGAAETLTDIINGNAQLLAQVVDKVRMRGDDVSLYFFFFPQTKHKLTVLQHTQIYLHALYTHLL